MSHPSASDAPTRHSYRRTIEMPEGRTACITYDVKAQCGYIALRDTPVEWTYDAGRGVLIDKDEDGHLVGIEVLGRQPDIADVLYVLIAWFQW